MTYHAPKSQEAAKAMAENNKDWTQATSHVLACLNADKKLYTAVADWLIYDAVWSACQKHSSADEGQLHLQGQGSNA